MDNKKHTELKDQQLTDQLKKLSTDEQLSSNFTHQVMQKIEAVQQTEPIKRLVPIWAWFIIGGSFFGALLLSIIYAPLPDEPFMNSNISDYQEELMKYTGIVIAGLFLYFSDTLLSLISKRSAK
jgi:hypothetical protein